MRICDLCGSKKQVHQRNLEYNQSVFIEDIDLCRKCEAKLSKVIKEAIRNSEFAQFSPFGEWHYKEKFPNT